MALRRAVMLAIASSPSVFMIEKIDLIPATGLAIGPYVMNDSFESKSFRAASTRSTNTAFAI